MSAHRVLSLFAGIGGFDLGFEQAGLAVVAQCEIDEKAASVLAARFPSVRRYRNVQELRLNDMVADGVVGEHGNVDLICGGFPCQDLSVAGRRAGLQGERSGLFFEAARLISECRPRWVVLENVPGLLSSNRGRDMGTVIATLVDLGYGVAWRVLDAQYFGVAQRRRRVFIVGYLGDASRAVQVLLEPEGGIRNPPPRRKAGKEAAATLGGGAGRRGFCDDLDRSGAFIPEIARCLTASNERNDGETETFLATPVAFSENQRGELVETDCVHPLTTGGGKPGQGYPAVRQGMAVRRLTPVECERLQGFPDNWTLVADLSKKNGQLMADSNRYRLLGNAVCVPVARWIGQRILNVERIQ